MANMETDQIVRDLREHFLLHSYMDVDNDFVVVDLNPGPETDVREWAEYIEDYLKKVYRGQVLPLKAYCALTLPHYSINGQPVRRYWAKFGYIFVPRVQGDNNG